VSAYAWRLPYRGRRTGGNAGPGYPVRVVSHDRSDLVGFTQPQGAAR
jgi:hypothetical protein